MKAKQAADLPPAPDHLAGRTPARNRGAFGGFAEAQAGFTPQPAAAGSRSSYRGLYTASPLERIALIKRGVRASEAKQMIADLNIAQGDGFRALNLPTATVNKKAKSGGLLSPEESERVIGLARLVGQVIVMLQESGDGTDFDAGSWLARWLTEPLPAFGGVRPADLMDTMEGQSMVSSAIAKMQSGAYA